VPGRVGEKNRNAIVSRRLGLDRPQEGQQQLVAWSGLDLIQIPPQEYETIAHLRLGLVGNLKLVGAYCRNREPYSSQNDALALGCARCV
jgi:hypothetical protein